MKKEEVLGKKLRVSRGEHNIFYTVKEVIEITDIYIFFLDKLDKKTYCRWADIEEVY